LARIWLVGALMMAVGISRAGASGTYFRPDAHALGQHTVLEKGGHRLGVRADFQDYSRVRLSNGLYQNVRDVRLRSYAFTGEYALTNDSVFYGSLPLVDNDAAIKVQEFSRVRGLGDVRLGYSRVHQLRNSSSLLWTTEISFPLEPYDTTKLTAPGDNSLDLTLLASFREASLFGSALYASLGGGVRLRASDAPHQWLWNAEVGGPVGRTASASVFIDSIDSMTGQALGSPEFLGDFSLLKQTATRLGARLSFTAKGFDGQLYYAKSIRWQNQAPSDFYGLSASRKF